MPSILTQIGQFRTPSAAALGLLGTTLLMATVAQAAPVVDANELKKWIDANDFEATQPPIEPPIEPPVEPPADVQPPPQASSYRLAWGDEFNDLSISNSFVHDGKRWYTETEPCCMPGGTTTYRVYPHVVAPTTVEQANPFSIVNVTDANKALKVTLKTVNGSWYGGGIASTDRDNQKGFAQKYGYWEARMKWSGPSSGPWLSFWAKSQERMGPPGANGMYTQVGEIDILEFWGDSPAMWSNLHDWEADTHQNACKAKTRSDFYSEFHTYGMMWTSQKMSFWFDNVKQCEVNTFSQGHIPYYVIFDLGMGGGYPYDKTPNPSEMFIDWVRIWAPSTTTQEAPTLMQAPSAEGDLVLPPEILNRRKDAPQ